MRHFHFKNLGELEQCASGAGATHVGFEHDPERVRTLLARKVRIGSFTLGNSIAIHPMEGCDGTLDGRPRAQREAFDLGHGGLLDYFLDKRALPGKVGFDVMRVLLSQTPFQSTVFYDRRRILAQVVAKG